MPTLDEVCARALALPCSPSLLPRLADLLARPNADIDELAQLIGLDPVLASATLRLANSAFFSSGASADSVGEAVMRIGARELYRLAALSLASRWMSIEADGYRWEAGDFCRASLVAAVAADRLAKRTGAVDPELAYTCGLVGQIGKLAVAYSCSSQFATIRAHRDTAGCTWLAAETAVLGFNHATVSARLLAEWMFPPACVSVAAHNPPDSSIPPEHLPMAAHVHAAQHVAATLGVGQGEDAFFYRLDVDLLAAHGIDAAMIESIMPDVYETASRLLQDRLSTGAVKF